MPNIDELMKDMESAEIGGRGRRLGNGDFEVTIDRVGVIDSKKRKGETRFVMEMTVAKVLRAENPQQDGPGVKASWTATFNNPKTFSNLKELFFALLGRVGADVPLSDPDHKLVTLLARAVCGSTAAAEELKKDFQIDDASTLVKGQSVRLNTEKVKTESNFDYVVHRWSPTPEAMEAAKAAQQAAQ